MINAQQIVKDFLKGKERFIEDPKRVPPTRNREKRMKSRSNRNTLRNLTFHDIKTIWNCK